MPEDNRLTAEQELCLRAAREGHNFLIFGEAGTGKSTVIVDICRQFHRGGKKFQVVCSTGIACEVFEDRLPAYHTPITINSFLGIGTAEGPFNHVVSKACRNETVARRIREIGSIVFDECSMGSARMLELFHSITAALRGSNKPFGESFIKTRLNSPIDESEEAVHLYFTNAASEAHNADCLYRLEGERFSFLAKDFGDVAGLKCAAKKEAFFKKGAPVICLYNINDNLHNGTRGSFLRKDGENAIIEVNGGEYVLKPVTWYNVNKEGKQVGSRRQIPLKLYWASTVHKSQGLQLDKAVVSCSHEFTGGLLYTAFSRVKKAQDLHVRGFKSCHVQDRSGEIAKINSHLQHCPFQDDNCKCHKPIDFASPDDCLPPPELDENVMSEIVSGLFDGNHGATSDDVDGGDGQFNMTLEDVLESMEEKESFLSKPPEDFDYGAFIASFKAVTGDDIAEFSDYVRQENDVIDQAIRLLPKFTILIKIIWLKIFDCMENHIKENVAQTKFSVNALKSIFHQTWHLNHQGEYKAFLQKAFQSPESSEEKRSLTELELSFGSQLVYGVLLNVLNVIANEVRSQCQNECSAFQVSEMDSQGKGKVRFVFAWAVSRLLKQSRAYVNSNMYSESATVQHKVRKERQKIEALESAVIVPYDILYKSTKYPETLLVTESRQYRSHGLLHVSDKVYEMSLRFEQARVSALNTNMLKLHGENLLQVASDTLKSDNSLLSEWKQLINEEIEVEEFIAQEMYSDLVNRYIHMGGNQFLRDFRREWEVQKSIAHRNNIMVRVEKKKRKEAKVPLAQICDDNTTNKVESHHKLQGLIASFGEEILSSVYTRAELAKLCSAYEVKFNSRTKKAVLGSDLAVAISRNSSIPKPSALSSTERPHAPIRIRILRVGVRITLSVT
ncbi:hypothetical protein ACROYT_G030097 [Oculina patagonica]